MQVLSNSVAEAMKLDDDPATKETQRFVHMFNRFFDMLNVRSVRESVLHRKPDVQPYRNPDDERLKVTSTATYSFAKLYLPTVARGRLPVLPRRMGFMCCCTNRTQCLGQKETMS